jgi:hypothetical protein
MAVLPDANTIGLWPFDEPQNAGPLALGNTNGQVGWKGVLGRSAALCEFTAQGTGNSVAASISDASNALRFERTAPFSVSFWCTYTGTSAGGAGAFNGSVIGNAAVTTSRGWRVGIGRSSGGNSRVPMFALISTLTTNELRVCTLPASFEINDGRLHHIVMTYDGSSTPAGCAIWVDGVSRTLVTLVNNLTGTIVAAGTPKIGALDDGLTSAITGTLQGISVWNGVVSPATIAALFAAGAFATPAPQAGLRAVWRLDQTDVYTVADGIVDHAGVGPYPATALFNLQPMPPHLSTTSTTGFPGLGPGPRLALGLGYDWARWFSNLSSFGDSAVAIMEQGIGAGVYGTRGWMNRMLLGPAYTVEMWIFQDVAGAQAQLVDTFPNIGGTARYFGLSILADRALRVEWTGIGATVDSAAGAVPIKQWAHVSVTCARTSGGLGTSYVVTVRVNAITVATATVPVPNPALPTDALGNNLSIGRGSSVGRQFIGGMAYVRFSLIARTLLEIQAAAADPANIVFDSNCYALWTMQETVPQIRDVSQQGIHLIQVGVGQNGAMPGAPFDGYGVTGPTYENLAHQFINVAALSDRGGLVRQVVPDAWKGQNEATFECFIRMDQNLGNHLLLNLGGNSTTSNSAIVMRIDLLSTQKMRAQWQGIGLYTWILETLNPVIGLGGVQSGEYGMFWCLATRKRAAGNRNYWRFNPTALSHYVTMVSTVAYNFERTQPFSLVVNLQRLAGSPALETLLGKCDNVTGRGYLLRLDASGRVEFRLDNGAGQAIEKRVTTTTVLNGQSQTVVVTYDGTSLAAGVNIYVGAVLQTMTTDLNTLASGTTVTTAPFVIGSRNGVDQFFPGFLQQAGVYTRVLTLAEIQALTPATGRPSVDLLALSTAPNLTGWWPFDQADTGSTVFNHATINSGHWYFFGTPVATMGDVLNVGPTDAFTLSVWVEAISFLTGGAEPIRKYDVNGRGYAMQIIAGKVRFYLGTTFVGSAGVSVDSVAAIPTGRHMLTVSIDGSGLAAGVRIWIDAVLQTTITNNNALGGGPTTNTQTLQVGAFSSFVTRVNDVAKWGVQLSTPQVVEAYGAGTPPNLNALPTAPAPQGWWKFDAADTTAAGGINDYSGANDATAGAGLEPASAPNGTPQNGLAPTVLGSCFIDFFKNAVLVETCGPLPAADVGSDIYAAAGNVYWLIQRSAAELDSRAMARMSNKARTDLELLDFFELETGVPQPPVISIEILSPLPVASLIDRDEPLVFVVRCDQAFVRIMIAVAFEGLDFVELAYAQDPASSAAQEFSSVYGSSTVSTQVEANTNAFLFTLRRTPVWPDSPQLRAYAFAGGGEL